MVIGILVQTDGNIGRVSMLDQMGRSTIDFQQQVEDNQGKREPTIDVDHQGLVGAGRLKQIVDSLFGCDIGGLLKQPNGNALRDGEG